MNRTFRINPIRCINILSVHFKNYYEALGVSPRASQADIKTAYFKLSMLYHPDRNQGCKVASAKFQDIKAAYETLSNHKLRRLYDRGIFADGYHDRPFEKVFKRPIPTVIKQRPVTTASTPIYNFDAWSRAHYDETLQRRTKAKADYETRKRFQETAENVAKCHTVTFTVLIIFVVCILLSKAYEDKVRPTRTDKK